MEHENRLAKRFTARELVRAYREAEKEIRRGFAVVHAAEEALIQAFGEGGSAYGFRVRDRYSRTSIRGNFSRTELSLLARRISRIVHDPLLRNR